MTDLDMVILAAERTRKMMRDRAERFKGEPVYQVAAFQCAGLMDLFLTELRQIREREMPR